MKKLYLASLIIIALTSFYCSKSDYWEIIDVSQEGHKFYYDPRTIVQTPDSTIVLEKTEYSSPQKIGDKYSKLLVEKNVYYCKTKQMKNLLAIVYFEDGTKQDILYPEEVKPIETGGSQEKIFNFICSLQGKGK
ncbi:MAG TPA: hypothetical protein PK447_10565 [Ignavibacteria bacterium]|nr:hypothetical protein [Ignavibacteria bacterium]